MSYREKLLKITKNNAEKYMNLSKKALSDKLKLEKDKDDPQPFFELPEDISQLYLKQLGKDIFSDGDVYCFFSKFNPYEHFGTKYEIITKSGLKKIIDDYHKSILEYYSKMIKDDGLNQGAIYSMITNKVNTWSAKDDIFKMTPYRLIEEGTIDDIHSEKIATDGSLEYQIFNLTFLYNTTDWEKEYIILSGW